MEKGFIYLENRTFSTHAGGQYNRIFLEEFTLKWSIFIVLFPEERIAFVLDHQHGRRTSRVNHY